MKIIYFLITLLSLNSLAVEFPIKCSLSGIDITNKAQEIFEKNEYIFPEAYLNHIDLDLNFSSSGSTYVGAVEGFYRPADTTQFSIMPTAIASVKLVKNTHLVYVCAQVNQDKKYFVEIYFLGLPMNAHQIQETVTQILTHDQIKLSALQLSILNLQTKGDNKVLNFLKMLLLPYYLHAKIFNGFANIFSTITGINIERVRITNDFVQVAGGINLNDPENPRFVKTIDLKSSEGQQLQGVYVK